MLADTPVVWDGTQWLPTLIRGESWSLALCLAPCCSVALGAVRAHNWVYFCSFNRFSVMASKYPILETVHLQIFFSLLTLKFQDSLCQL